MNNLNINLELFYKIIFICFLVFHLGTTSEEETQKCPLQLRSFCRCENSVYNELKPDRLVYLTNCSYSNINNVSFLHYLPVETQVLLLNNNNLTSLPDHLLSNPENYKKLEVIDFSNNRIEFIQNNTFENLTEVRILNLNHNNLHITKSNFHPKLFASLSEIEALHLRNAFDETEYGTNFIEDLNAILLEAKLTKLKILNLAENHIRSLPNPFAFCSLPSLQKLYLNRNLLLDQIELNFNCTPNLILLDLSNNLITKLSNTTIETFDESKLLFHLNLTNNPFKCDCELINFYDWLHRTKLWIINSKIIQCASGYPESNIGKPLMSLNISNFMCKDENLDDEKFAYRKHLIITYTIIISLVASLIVILLAAFFLRRKSISFYWQELSNSIAKKRDYVPLEKDNKKVEGQTTDPLENKDEENHRQQQSVTTQLQLNATEIDEDVV